MFEAYHVGQGPARPLRRYIGSLAENSIKVVPRILATLIFFVAFEGVIFHTRLYPSILEPESTAGAMEMQ
ncbi:MAG TPA: hypothetical protein VK776_21705, partial [Bryobacteraceae bacterium]|nr:hypothetical protein [Bryobacteraceae bacterium]